MIARSDPERRAVNTLLNMLEAGEKGRVEDAIAFADAFVKGPRDAAAEDINIRKGQMQTLYSLFASGTRGERKKSSRKSQRVEMDYSCTQGYERGLARSPQVPCLVMCSTFSGNRQSHWMISG